MKKFDKFLKEVKGDAEFKSGSFDVANTEGELRKSKDRKITKRSASLQSFCLPRFYYLTGIILFQGSLFPRKGIH